MALSGVTVDWPSGVITVPRAGMDLVQVSPTEIRQMNLNEFRLALKALEETVDGMVFTKTHDHNTEVTLGGITYARIIEILDPYTITFENGLYAVDLVGANSNVGDRVNVNNVSVRSNNSAGLISTTTVEYSSFEGGVTIDVDDGVAGTIFPTGTAQQPSNNLTDAKLIADFRGLERFYVRSNLTFDEVQDLSGWEVIGLSHVQTNITFTSGVTIDDMTIRNGILNGVMDDNLNIFDCIIENVTHMNGHIHNSSLSGTITLGGNLNLFMSNCATLDVGTTPILDMGGSGQSASIPDYSGLLYITNMSGSTDSVGIGLDSGQITLDSNSVTNGSLIASGIGSLTDENGNRILSGTWNGGGMSIINQLINTYTISEATQLGGGVYVDVSGITGTTYPIGTNREPSNNIPDAVTIAEKLGVDNIYFLSNFTVESSINIDGYGLIGEGITSTLLTFEGGCIVANCTTHHMEVTGDLSGIIGFYDSRLDDLGSIGLVPSSQEIITERCLFDGTTTLPSNYSGLLTVIDSYSNVPGNLTPILDFGESTADLQIRNWTGGLELRNMISGNTVSVDIVSGKLKLHESCTNATVVARGVGAMVASSTGAYIPTGIWNGGVDVNNDVMSKGTVSDAVLNTELSGYTTPFTVATSMQLAAYDNAVWVNVLSGTTGTIYPHGTRESPVNNLADAITIAESLNFNTLQIPHDFTFGSSIDISGYKIYGNGHHVTTFTLESGSTLNGCQFFSTEVEGSAEGVEGFYDCHLIGFVFEDTTASPTEIVFQNSLMQGDLQMANNFTGTLEIINCWAIPSIPSSTPIPPLLDLNDGDMNVVIRDYSGKLAISNSTNASNFISIIIEGEVLLNDTVTAGTVKIVGVGTLTDNSNGATVNSDGLMSKTTISSAVWDEPLGNHVLSGTTGDAMRFSQYNDEVNIDINGISGTTYPIGTKEEPVNNITDAIVIASSLGTINLSFNSNFTIDQNVSGYSLQSQIHARLTILSGATTFFTGFEDVAVSGTLNGYTVFHDASISSGGITGFYGLMDNTVISGPIGISSDNTKNAVILDSYIGDVTTPPTVDCGGDGAKVSLRGLTGALLFVNKTGATQPMFIDLYSARVGFDSTVTAGSITVRGVGYIYLDDSTNTTFDLQGLMSKDTISVAVWDEPLTKITHNLPASAGRRLRALSSIVLLEDDVLSGTTNTITLQGASTTDGAYDPSMITITDGLGAGQTRLILQYNGAEMTAVVDRNWKTIPDDTSTYLISANPGREHVNEGLAQSGTTSTITLNPLASPFDSAYSGQIVFIRSGTGEDQALRVLSYNGTTKVATLYNDWNVIPDKTSAYVMLPTGGIEEGFVADAVWNKTLP